MSPNRPARACRRAAQRIGAGPGGTGARTRELTEMPEPEPTSEHAGAVSCEHDYVLEGDLEMWVCTKCGSALELTAQVQRHECGPDCDRHEDISAIG